MFGVFYARRMLRILPLARILVIALFWMVGSADSLWPYLTFTQNFGSGRPMVHWGPMWTGVTWSLAVEEQFYLVLPLIIWCTRPRLLPVVVLGLCGIAPVARWVCAQWLYSSHYASYLLMPCRMDALFGGVLVAWFVRSKRCVNRHLLGGVIAVLGFGLVIMLGTGQQDLSGFMITIGYTWIAAFYACILLLVAMRGHSVGAGLVEQPFRLLGLGAYAIYLFHQPLLSVLTRVGLQWSVGTVLAACATLTASWFSWRFIERPCIVFGQQQFRYRNVMEKTA